MSCRPNPNKEVVTVSVQIDEELANRAREVVGKVAILNCTALGYAGIGLEVCSIKRFAPISIAVHMPTTEAGRAKLAKCVASAHADAATYYIQHLTCPVSQKIDLLNAVIKTISEQKKEMQTN